MSVEPVRTVDLEALRASADRTVQRLLDRTSGATSCTVSVIKTPPRSGSPEGLHTHTVDQIFYVLDGVMSIEVEGRTYEARPGSLVVFPAGVAHRNWNAGSAATVHLSITAPLPDPSVPFATPAVGA